MRQIVVLATAVALSVASYAASAQTQNPAATTSGAGQTRPTTSISKATQKFVNKAANTNMLEIQTGQLAQQKAADDAYKQFGKMIQDDHTKASEQLKSIAQNISGLKIPAALDAGHKKNLDKLQGLSGARFETAFKAAQVKGHQQGVKLFEDYAKSGDNAELKKFAEDTLPVLQKHLQQAQALPKPAGGPASASAPSGNTTSGSAPAGKNGSGAKSGGSAY
ncbi:MAG TPA: DUF4142 domain-containing protein [Xanthobacteraceae bacterium]|nr:DUF4142 domain-containing protein [Xanthobacteraceae bacterium]